MLIELLGGLGLVVGILTAFFTWKQLKNRETPAHIAVSNQETAQIVDASTTNGPFHFNLTPASWPPEVWEVPTPPTEVELSPDSHASPTIIEDERPPLPVVEFLMEDEMIEVESGGYTACSYDLKQGDQIRGILREADGYKFNLYVMNEKEYARFCAYRESRDLFSSEDESSVHLDLEIPHEDTWYLVFDGYGKRLDRSIECTLRRMP